MELIKDHYDKLPSLACEVLDNIARRYSEEDWFEEAWLKYRTYILKTPSMKQRMPGYIFKEYIKPNAVKNTDTLIHYGVLGMKWGIRKAKGETVQPRERKKLTEQQKNTLKTVGLISAGVAAGAIAVGAVWYLKNARAIKLETIRKAAMVAKRNATRAANKAAGLHKTYKNVEVTVRGMSKAVEFTKTFANVNVAKLFL